MSKAKTTTRPNKDFSSITQNGLSALGLANSHKTLLEPRLPTGLIAQLESDLIHLGTIVPAAKQSKHTQQAFTLSQAEALAQGYALVTAIRTAVQRRGAPIDVRKAYGVGAKVNPTLVKDVLAAIGAIVDEANKNIAAAGAYGILASDITALSNARDAIQKADQAQEKVRNEAPLTTKLRNETAGRIVVAVDAIVSAGLIQFALDPKLRAEFEALIGKGNPNAKAEPKGDAASPKKPAKEK